MMECYGLDLGLVGMESWTESRPLGYRGLGLSWWVEGSGVVSGEL